MTICLTSVDDDDGGGGGSGNGATVYGMLISNGIFVTQFWSFGWCCEKVPRTGSTKRRIDEDCWWNLDGINFYGIIEPDFSARCQFANGKSTSRRFPKAIRMEKGRIVSVQITQNFRRCLSHLTHSAQNIIQFDRRTQANAFNTKRLSSGIISQRHTWRPNRKIIFDDEDDDDQRNDYAVITINRPDHDAELIWFMAKYEIWMLGWINA